LALARTEAQAGNSIGAENYYQHAEHFSDRCAQLELPNLTGTLAVIKYTDFLKSYSYQELLRARSERMHSVTNSASPSWMFSPRRVKPAFPSKPVQ
jgi:hypothetical protein